MGIRELEKALRAAIGKDEMRLALASLAGHGQSDIQVPSEVEAAVSTLISRGHKKVTGTSIMDPATIVWL